MNLQVQQKVRSAVPVRHRHSTKPNAWQHQISMSLLHCNLQLINGFVGIGFEYPGLSGTTRTRPCNAAASSGVAPSCIWASSQTVRQEARGVALRLPLHTIERNSYADLPVGEKTSPIFSSRSRLFMHLQQIQLDRLVFWPHTTLLPREKA